MENDAAVANEQANATEEARFDHVEPLTTLQVT